MKITFGGCFAAAGLKSGLTAARLLAVRSPLFIPMEKGLIMSSRFGESRTDNAVRCHRKGKRRRDKLAISESQIQAYLIARDVLRHLQQASSAQSRPAADPQDGSAYRHPSPKPGGAGGIDPLAEGA